MAELVSPEHALFENESHGIIAMSFQNERPPRGLLGTLDWYLKGVISSFIKKGVITGRPGECIYLPYPRAGSTDHLFLLGGGYSEAGMREPIPVSSFSILQKNLASLCTPSTLPKIIVSKSDLGHSTSEIYAKHLRGIPLWITA